jgi:hypothetical protein
VAASCAKPTQSPFVADTFLMALIGFRGGRPGRVSTGVVSG